MSGSEILVILFAILLLFGAKSLPEIARTLGKVTKEFNKATREIKREFEESTDGIKKDIMEPGKKIEKDITEIINDTDPLNEKKG